MKRFFSIIGLLILIISTLPGTIFAQNPPETMEDAVGLANEEVRIIYAAQLELIPNSNTILASSMQSLDKTSTFQSIPDSFKTYNYYDINKINRSVWDSTSKKIKDERNTTMGALVYGSPHGDNKNGEYRYLGKTPEGDEYTNYNFPHDSFAGGYLDDRNWIEIPWENDDVKGIDISPFNGLERYKDNIRMGLKEIYPDNFRDDPKDWHNYVHILQPPTDYTWGMGRMWHKTGDGKNWYITVPLAPTLLPEKPLPPADAPTVILDCSPGTAFIGRSTPIKGYVTNNNDFQVISKIYIEINGKNIYSDTVVMGPKETLTVRHSYNVPSSTKIGEMLNVKLIARQVRRVTDVPRKPDVSHRNPKYREYQRFIKRHTHIRSVDAWYRDSEEWKEGSDSCIRAAVPQPDGYVDHGLNPSRIIED